MSDRQQLLAKARALYPTDTALAEALDVTRRTVLKWRSGEAPISRVTELALLQLIAQHEAKP